MRSGGAGRATTLVSGATEGCTTRSTAAKIRSSTAEPYTSAMADLRTLPSVDRILQEPAARELAARAGRDVAVAAVRRALEERRRAGIAGDDRDAAAAAIAQEALDREAPHLRPVVNATGVIVHTNLGRAPLAREALAAATAIAGGYANLELDLETGGRGSRQDAVAPLIASLTGAEAGLAVSNNAAALVLVLSALAAGRDVLVSRGQLVEIGDGFRIPDILAASGARLVEVGSTNRTSAADYERAISAETALLLRVHPSNYRIVGFTEEVDTATLAEIGGRHGLPVLDDLGSGLLAPDPVFAGEPDARAAIAAGADAGLLLRRQAAGRPAERHHRRHPRGRRPRPPPSAGARRAHRQAGGGRAGGDAAAAPRPGAGAGGDPGAAHGARARGRACARAPSGWPRPSAARSPTPSRGSAAARCRPWRCRPAPPRCPIRAASCTRRCGRACRR